MTCCCCCCDDDVVNGVDEFCGDDDITDVVAGIEYDCGLIAGSPVANLTGWEALIEVGGSVADDGDDDNIVVAGNGERQFFSSISLIARIAISSELHSVPGQCCVTSRGSTQKRESLPTSLPPLSGRRRKSA